MCNIVCCHNIILFAGYYKYNRVNMNGNRPRCVAITDCDLQQNILDGELHIVRTDLGLMGGATDLFYFHPAMAVAPHFVCSLCGALIRTYSGVYKHKNYCKLYKQIYEGIISHTRFQDNRKTDQGFGISVKTIDNTNKRNNRRLIKNREQTVGSVSTSNNKRREISNPALEIVVDQGKKQKRVAKAQQKTYKKLRMLTELITSQDFQAFNPKELGQRKTRSGKKRQAVYACL